LGVFFLLDNIFTIRKTPTISGTEIDFWGHKCLYGIYDPKIWKCPKRAFSMFPGGKPFSRVFSENAKNFIFVKKWNFYENRVNRDFQGTEVSAKK
jgi:hypothetical protein